MIGSNSNSYYFGSSHIFGNETRIGKDTEKIEEVFGKSDTYCFRLRLSFSAPDLSRCLSIILLKQMIEMTYIFIPYLLCDLFNGQCRLFQQLLCVLHAYFNDILLE